MRIYLDHNATTRPHPEVREALAPWLGEHFFGNPSSVHAEGRIARDAVERARAQVAALLAGRPEEIVFTSGGTEGDNLAVIGGARLQRSRHGRARVVASPLEHPAVLGSLEVLRGEGFDIRFLSVDPDGRIDIESLIALCDPADTALVTCALANHEIGNIHPIAEIARVGHAAGALVHSDAVQAAGKLPLDVGTLDIDLLTISSHKMYGPKGAGALWVRRGLDLPPLFQGGHQERERRAGTENVAGIVGFGAACAVARRELAAWSERISRLRDRLESGALRIPGARRFGADPRVPGTTSIGWAGVDGELVMMNLDLAGVAVSTGAACTSGSLAPSRVLLALGADRATARTAVRFSLGWENTAAEVDAVLALLPEIIDRVRAIGAE